MTPERSSDSAPSVPTVIREAAATWLGHHERGLTRAQGHEFEAWLASDPRHARAFAEIEATWRTLDRAASLRTCGDPDPDLLAPRRTWRRAVTVTLATAAAVTFAYVSWWRPSFATFDRTAVTHVGEARTLMLPDGSVVRLNTDTDVAIHFTRHERRLTLARGEAFFTVAKNPARPFIVAAGDVAVRAVGTAFNVRLDSADVEVLVTEGRVRVADRQPGSTSGSASQANTPHGSPAATPAPAEPDIVAGQKMTISANTPPVVGRPPRVPVAVSPPEIDRMLAWHQERLEFASTPLAQVVAQFNRYNRHQLVIADPRLEDMRFGGSFRPDGYAALVSLLKTNFGVAAEEQADRTLLRLAP